MICLPIYKWGSMVSYSFKPSKNLNQIRVGCQHLPSRITKMSFLWNIYYLYITEPRSAISQKSHTKWILHRGNKRAIERDFTPECSHSAHAWTLWPLPFCTLSRELGFVTCTRPWPLPRTSRESLSGYRRNVFLPGCRPMKAQAAMTQEGPCLNRKEQTV